MEDSLDEVNAQRVALGLKPLTAKKAGQTKPPLSKKEKEDEDDDAFDMFAIREQEKADEEAEVVRSKISSARMKRKIAQSLEAEVGLGDSGPVESTKDWIASFSKRTQQAQETHKKLEQHKIKKQKVEEKNALAAEVPAGMMVGHKADDFEEGSTIILTLKDERILERKGVTLKERSVDEEDVLENVQLVEKEKTKKNLLLKAKGKAKGLQNRGLLEDDGSKKKSILSKYDEEDELFFS